jgi:hypothetical protein
VNKVNLEQLIPPPTFSVNAADAVSQSTHVTNKLPENVFVSETEAKRREGVHKMIFEMTLAASELRARRKDSTKNGNRRTVHAETKRKYRTRSRSPRLW